MRVFVLPRANQEQQWYAAIVLRTRLPVDNHARQAIGDIHSGLLDQRLGESMFHDFGEQPFLRPEVAIDHRGGHAGIFGDLANSGLLVALEGETSRGRFEDADRVAAESRRLLRGVCSGGGMAQSPACMRRINRGSTS
jgi:hypothetical protein